MQNDFTIEPVFYLSTKGFDFIDYKNDGSSQATCPSSNAGSDRFKHLLRDLTSNQLDEKCPFIRLGDVETVTVSVKDSVNNTLNVILPKFISNVRMLADQNKSSHVYAAIEKGMKGTSDDIDEILKQVQKLHFTGASQGRELCKKPRGWGNSTQYDIMCKIGQNKYARSSKALQRKLDDLFNQFKGGLVTNMQDWTRKQEAATLASLVYEEDKDKRNKVLQYLGDYTVLEEFTTPHILVARNRYFVWISFRGTVPTDRRDLLQDLDIAVTGHANWRQWEYEARVKEIAQKYPKCLIRLTGHSLGGQISRQIGTTFAEEPWLFESHSFNPGTGLGQVPNAMYQALVDCKSGSKPLGAWRHGKCKKVFVHLIKGDPISYLAQFFPTSTVQDVHAKGALQAHKMDKFDQVNLVPAANTQ